MAVQVQHRLGLRWRCEGCGITFNNEKDADQCAKLDVIDKQVRNDRDNLLDHIVSWFELTKVSLEDQIHLLQQLRQDLHINS